uniref:Transmembrane protein n=1 Tax=Oryza sativa subsp. japonica TaxID=39947 RepID=Q6ZKR2_ORYSJ|nr:hypothetical protein [Oryza sativa Japonica Group]
MGHLWEIGEMEGKREREEKGGEKERREREEEEEKEDDVWILYVSGAVAYMSVGPICGSYIFVILMPRKRHVG